MSDLLSLTAPRVEEHDGRKVLLVGKYIQSIAVDDDHEFDVWDAFIPRHRHPWRVLILGAGGGTIATLLTQSYGPIAITAIERDPAVAQLARADFGLVDLPNVQLLEANAFDWVVTDDQSYDLICIDLYVAGEIVHGVFATTFLRQIARLLTPGGIAAFNLFKTKRVPEQMHRLSRIFNIVDRIDIGGNIVVHCMRD